MTKIFHCSYHKCLTVYYSRIHNTLYNKILKYTLGYKHFNSLIDDFYNNFHHYKVTSINNHALDFNRLGSDFRISRFIRDPRDLIVSGYFYHKRGAEPWCNIINPKIDDWKVVNGCLPEEMTHGFSFSSYLQSLNTEDGLIAEINFRKNHFTSMRSWPDSDHRIKIFRYEDLIGNELDVFRELFSFYGLAWPEKRLALFLTNYFSARKQTGKTPHIRNARTSQWKEHFTPKVISYFEQHFGDLLERYNYT